MRLGHGRVGERGQSQESPPVILGVPPAHFSPHFLHGSPAMLHSKTWEGSGSSWTMHGPCILEMEQERNLGLEKNYVISPAIREVHNHQLRWRQLGWRLLNLHMQIPFCYHQRSDLNFKTSFSHKRVGTESTSQTPSFPLKEGTFTP